MEDDERRTRAYKARHGHAMPFQVKYRWRRKVCRRKAQACFLN